MCVDVELDGHVLVHLNVKLLDTVFAENPEDATARILSWNFNDIILRHPRITCSGRHATLGLQYCDDSSC